MNKKNIYIIFISLIYATYGVADDDVKKMIKVIDKTNVAINKLNGPISSFCNTSLHGKESKEEVTKKRKVSKFIDKCFKDLKLSRPETFEQSIKIAIGQLTTPEGNSLSSYISGAYGVKKWNTNVSLISQPMCETIDKKFLTGNDKTKLTRLSKISKELVKIPKEYNRLRNIYLKSVKDKESKELQEKKKVEVLKFYYHLMKVIADKESLGDPDTTTSKNNAKAFAKHYKVKDFTKPPGVKFYYDKYQSNADSKRNMGLYQFSADPKGNVVPCIKSWNEKFGAKQASCKLPISKVKKANSDLFKILAASDQVFNAYCGAHKLVQSYGIQVNAGVMDPSKSRRRTHSENLGKDKKLKKGKDRCVSVFALYQNIYGHFGTLGFTTSDNTINVVKSLNKILFPAK